jgi:ADP-heptose:LPS heptosyltransferase
MINTGILRTGAIGDLISLTPAIKLYAKSHPDEKLTLICGETYAHVLRANPYISDIITFNDRAIYQGSSASKTVETLKLAYAMRKLDKCFIMHEDSRWELVADIAGIMEKHTLRSEGNRYERAMACMNVYGSSKPEYHPQNECSHTLPDEYICIACGGGQNTKQNTPQRRWKGYAELINRLSGNIVLIGTEEDSPNITDTDITDLCGKTSLDEAYHIINGAKLFIGNDSGLLHLALCTNTETIGVFTATDPQIVLPIDTNAVTVQSALPCSPCEKSGNTRTDCNSECVDENIIDFILYSEKSGSLSNF